MTDMTDAEELLPRWLDGDDAALEEWIGEQPLEEILARFDIPARRRFHYRRLKARKKGGREGGP